MDNIIEPNESFDFSNISLAHPIGIQGGAYFTKIEFNKKPLYIQTSKSLTRQGFVKSGKKYYCDLMFDKNSESFINWLENLEEKCHKLIYEKKDAWFQGNLEETDIETAFNPLIRVYKSGKYYLLRTNIKKTIDDIPAVKIYNENEITLDMSLITPETEIISILDIQGIKFTSRNFQIDIVIKQIMVIDNEPIFNNCLIKKDKKVKSLDESIRENINKNDGTSTNVTEDVLLQDYIENKNSINENDLNVQIQNNEDFYNKNYLDTLEEIDSLNDLQKNESKQQENIPIDFEDLIENIEENNDELKEIDNNDLNLEKIDESLTLKKPNQVYFELYKEARNKAKEAKKNAILAYLKAKNIKKTYMIENINDSDSDFDAEIEEVSESELEGL